MGGAPGNCGWWKELSGGVQGGPGRSDVATRRRYSASGIGRGPKAVPTGTEALESPTAKPGRPNLSPKGPFRRGFSQAPDCLRRGRLSSSARRFSRVKNGRGLPAASSRSGPRLASPPADVTVGTASLVGQGPQEKPFLVCPTGDGAPS